MLAGLERRSRQIAQGVEIGRQRRRLLPGLQRVEPLQAACQQPLIQSVQLGHLRDWHRAVFTSALPFIPLTIWTLIADDTADADHSDVGRDLLEEFAPTEADRELVLRTVKRHMGVAFHLYDQIYEAVQTLH